MEFNSAFKGLKIWNPLENHETCLDHFDRLNLSEYWSPIPYALSWMRHCATNQKVAGSIRDWLIWIIIDLILPAAQWHRGESTSNKNEYQEYIMEVKTAGA